MKKSINPFSLLDCKEGILEDKSCFDCWKESVLRSWMVKKLAQSAGILMCRWEALLEEKIWPKVWWFLHSLLETRLSHLPF